MKKMFFILCAFFIFLTTKSEAQITFQIDNTTNAQYHVDCYDDFGNLLGQYGVGVYSFVPTIHFVELLAINRVSYCKVTIGLGGPPPTSGDIVWVGIPGNVPGYPDNDNSINSYAFLGGSPYKVLFHSSGTLKIYI